MKSLVPPSLFGLPYFLRKYLKKAEGDTPTSETPDKPKEPKYAKIVPANYDPKTDPANQFQPSGQEYEVPDLSEEDLQRSREYYGIGYPRHEDPPLVLTDETYTPSNPNDYFYDTHPNYDELVQETSESKFQSLLQNKDNQDFIQAIKQDPDDASSRLMWADWLEENAHPDLAESIRIQQYLVTERERFSNDQRNEMMYRLSDLCASHPEWFGEWGWIGRGTWRGTRREQPEGLASLDRGLLQVEGSMQRVYGVFLDSGAGPASTIQLREDAREALANVESVKLDIGTPEDLGLLIRLPYWIENISSFSLTAGGEGGPGLNRTSMRRLVPHFRNLTELRLPGNYLGGQGGDQDALEVWELLNSPAIRNLRALDLSNNELTIFDFGELAHSENLQHLQDLDLSGNPINDDFVAELVQSPYLRDIRRLAINEDGLSPDAIQALQQRFPGDVLELHHQELYEPEWIEPMPNLPNEIEPPDLENI